MGLKKHEQTPLKSLQGAQGGGDFLRIMAEIVDHRHSMGGADDIETAAQPLEAPDGGHSLRDGHARRFRRRQRGERVGDVMAAGHLHGHRIGFAARFQRKSAAQWLFDHVDRAEIRAI